MNGPGVLVRHRGRPPDASRVNYLKEASTFTLGDCSQLH